MTANTVAEHLPLLRRYARALSGSQDSGDAYVATTLQALIEDPSILDDESNPKNALYKAFTRIWNSVGFNRSEGGGDRAPHGPDRHLSEIAPLPRLT